MRDVRAALLAGGQGERMGRLTEHVSKPMVPYGGSCRLVDFSVANVVRSGIDELVVMSRHRERELLDHLLRSWDGRGGLHVNLGTHESLLPRNRRMAGDGLPRDLDLSVRPDELGTADALQHNAEWVFAPGAKDVLILHADHVYLFDYRPMIQAHRESNSDATIGVQRIARRYVSLFGMVEVDRDNRVLQLVEKPAEPTSDLVFTAFCVFRADALRDVLAQFAKLPADRWRHDISRDVLPAMIADKRRVRAFQVREYWADIGTVERYHQGHFELLWTPATLALNDLPRTLPGARPVFDRHDRIVTSAPLPAGAHVRESVIYPSCVIEPGARIERSVVLPGARVRASAEIHDTVIREQEVISGRRSGLGGLAWHPRRNGAAFAASKIEDFRSGI
jgi:glucose-1-phosphate adenylyltransferase